MTQNQKIMVFAKGANGFYWLSFCKILFGPMLNLPNLVYCSYAICPTDTRSFSHYSPMFCISNSISLDKNPFTPDNAVLSSGEISECILLTERGQWLAIVWHLFVVTRYWVLLARLASHTCGHACVPCFPMAVRWRDHPLPPLLSYATLWKYGEQVDMQIWQTTDMLQLFTVGARCHDRLISHDSGSDRKRRAFPVRKHAK